MIVSTLLFASCKTQTVEGELLINHTGYQAKGMKKAVLQTLSDITPDNFMVINELEEVVFEGKFEKGGKIDHWHTGNAYEANFTEFTQSGTFKAVAKLGSGTIESRFFTIDNSSFAEKALELLVDGFESQHVVGKFNEKDAKMSFFGDRNDIVDVSGGWYDASGDHAKYLSHLSYANFLNPQQTPLFVWNLLESVDQYTKNNDRPDTGLRDRMLAEASYGADYLVRMQDEAGYFYLTVFANWSGDPERREICAYIGQDGKRTDEYQAAFREGGGMAIAALARASKMPNSGDFTSENYLEVAKKGFAHLLEYNVNYVDDGKENIIDDYCALLAATELYAVTDEAIYLEHARKRMQQLVDRLSDDENYKGWWLADDGNRPYFHASDAGLPLITLNRYLAFETDEDMKNKAVGAVQRSIDFELSITNEVNNPFGYPRQYVKALDEDSNRGCVLYSPSK